MRQLVYNLATVSLPDFYQNVVPLIDPFHISLDPRECVLKQFYPIFAELYSFMFGHKAKLQRLHNFGECLYSLKSYMVVGHWSKHSFHFSSQQGH